MQRLLSSSNLSMALIDNSDIVSGPFYCFFAKENLILRRFFIIKAVSESKIRFY